MVVGSGLIELFIPDVHSLKEKRSVVTKLIRKTQNEFNVSIAEVGGQDVWQRAQIGFAFVGNDRRVIDAKMNFIRTYMEDLRLAEIVGYRGEIVTYSQWMEDGMTPYGEDKYGDR